MKTTISEARLNDLCYMALKHLFFQGVGLGGPRQCDIRIVMDMSVPERLTLASAILLPNEVAPSSHTKMHEVDTDNVFTQTIDYLEDHWMKQTMAEATGDPDVVSKMKTFFDEVIIPAVMSVAEDQCAITESA